MMSVLKTGLSTFNNPLYLADGNNKRQMNIDFDMVGNERLPSTEDTYTLHKVDRMLSVHS
jgi:hypothetical protein